MTNRRQTKLNGNAKSGRDFFPMGSAGFPGKDIRATSSLIRDGVEGEEYGATSKCFRGKSCDKK